MPVSEPIPPGRYRRRILGLGALAFVVTFAIGAAIFIPVVQDDLVDRVEDELAEAGVDGIEASFSGQDGTLSCDRALDEPDAAVALAEDVHGVRVIDLDQSCVDTTSGTVEPSPETAATDDTGTTEPIATEATTDAATSTTTTTIAVPPATEPGGDAILDIVGGDPLFSELAAALATAGLDGDDGLGGEGPFTLLAPTDAAFDATFDELGADAFNQLTSDPDALRALLLHHATEGAIFASDFDTGDLAMLDGTTVTVDPDAAGGITFTSGGGASGVEDPATQLDIEAANGIVHAIDRLLIPDALRLDVDAADPATTTSSLSGGRITLSGVVPSEDARTQLVTAAAAVVDPTNVVDELTVDPGADVADAADAFDGFLRLVEAMPPNLVDGEATLVGDELALTGTFVDEAAQATLLAVGDDLDASLELAARDAADDESAAALQSELNDFVQANPILFEPNSAMLTPDAAAILDQVAARANRLVGTAITIVGHTDSDGDPASNQALSLFRAGSVLEALVARGLDPGGLEATGRGSSEPVTDEAGAEDKAASRRVEFVVEVAG